MWYFSKFPNEWKAHQCTSYIGCVFKQWPLNLLCTCLIKGPNLYWGFKNLLLFVKLRSSEKLVQRLTNCSFFLVPTDFLYKNYKLDWTDTHFLVSPGKFRVVLRSILCFTKYSAVCNLLGLYIIMANTWRFSSAVQSQRTWKKLSFITHGNRDGTVQ